ncbi:uncharacterized protein LY79DRAFT_405281 [Colletotrichum navitas]|uniref:Secreted protein n=1 Tax=Colletotrichum navitas TaxID=681940 RepID=A0AAD8V8N9_9PEZI|nr:uncharacterized protein LY79DRAFT_405281 [Colletotrichum navitas]KAK1597109.1 hypothetical protein LY79DRAFT_405281 [Colletotrichum navitas]
MPVTLFALLGVYQSSTMFGTAPSVHSCSETPEITALVTATDIGRSTPIIACRAPRSSTKPPISALLITMPISEPQTRPISVQARRSYPVALAPETHRMMYVPQRERRSKSDTYCVLSTGARVFRLHTFTRYCYVGGALMLQARTSQRESPTIPTCKSLGSEAWPPAFVVRQRITHVGFCGPPETISC